jgi:hypothetical protein
MQNKMHYAATRGPTRHTRPALAETAVAKPRLNFLAAKAGLRYDAFIQRIVDEAMSRPA